MGRARGPGRAGNRCAPYGEMDFSTPAGEPTCEAWIRLLCGRYEKISSRITLGKLSQQGFALLLSCATTSAPPPLFKDVTEDVASVPSGCADSSLGLDDWTSISPCTILEPCTLSRQL